LQIYLIRKKNSKMSSSNLSLNSKVRLNNGVDMPIFGLGLIIMLKKN
jgi:hypothetical protein